VPFRLCDVCARVRVDARRIVAKVQQCHRASLSRAFHAWVTAAAVERLQATKPDRAAPLVRCMARMMRKSLWMRFNQWKRGCGALQ